MALPLKYNLRNVVVRWKTTVFTVLGIAAVVAVFVLLRALARGIEATSANTGDPRNVLVVRKGSQAESGSLVSRANFQTIRYFDEIARNERGEPLISAEVVLIVSVPRRGTTNEANTLIRGVTPRGMELRPQVNLVPGFRLTPTNTAALGVVDRIHRRFRSWAGLANGPVVVKTPAPSRWFVPGKRELVVSSSLAERFQGFDIGDTIKAGRDRLTVVGHFDGEGSAYDSEAWMDADEARSLFDRDMYSSFLIRPRDAAAASNIIARVEADKRLALRAEHETDYYAKQTMTAVPIKILALILGTAMSIGAVFAAMNTMYASVAARTREIGTLRVLGYSRRSIVLCFLIEGALLAAVGGALGSGLSLLLNGYATGTMNFQSFAETVFKFRITPDLMLTGVAFSVAIGLAGSFLPALRAARLPVISALKSL